MKITKKKILITGGASGIGLALTEKFISNDNIVIICGRRQSALEAVAAKNTGVIIKQCDVAIESERVALFQWIKAEHPDLNILINNAGIQNWMKIDDPDFFSKASNEIKINIEAPIHLVSMFLQLPSLTTIMNVTSALAFAPFTKVPVYSATKAFLHSFNWSISHLLRDSKIKVIEIVPPALNTDLGGKGLHDWAPPVNDFIEYIFKEMELGKTQLTMSFGESMMNAGQEILQPAFDRMNPTTS